MNQLALHELHQHLGAHFTEVNGAMFFVARNNSNGEVLWKTDGTNAGTVVVRPSNPVLAPSSLTSVGGLLYFSVNKQVWKSDGTDAGPAARRYTAGCPRAARAAPGQGGGAAGPVHQGPCALACRLLPLTCFDPTPTLPRQETRCFAPPD